MIHVCKYHYHCIPGEGGNSPIKKIGVLIIALGAKTLNDSWQSCFKKGRKAFDRIVIIPIKTVSVSQFKINLLEA